MLGRANKRLIGRSQADLVSSRSLAIPRRLLSRGIGVPPSTSLSKSDDGHHVAQQLRQLLNSPTLTSLHRCRTNNPAVPARAHGGETSHELPRVDASNLLRKLVDSDGKEEQTKGVWRHRIARLQSSQLSVIIAQMVLREQARLTEDKALFELLPKDHLWNQILNKTISDGHSMECLTHCRNVLLAETDTDRWRLFLAYPRPTPAFLVQFLLRRRSDIRDASTLGQMIARCRIWYNGQREQVGVHTAARPRFNWRERQYLEDMGGTTSFIRLIDLLSYHCLRVEPRLIVKVAELAAQRIESLSTTAQNPNRIFHNQCTLFNESLEAFQLNMRWQAPQIALPNQYFWEAQRTLLEMSSSLPRPLLVNRKGFRAIRATLSGLSKNSTERHMSLRHDLSWPPYLRAIDGMDEGLEADEGWSRAVQAGAMMQEAGFPKTIADEAVDTLQGLGLDGTPTIQQRVAIRLGRDIGPWEASIRATRNAHEAWMNFQHHPMQHSREDLLRPGPDEYAAMFEKLSLRDSDLNSDILPGDKALNFPFNNEHNLSDFEKAKLQPPSVAELYRDMKDKNVVLNLRCLRVLLDNADSYDTAHGYLRYYTNNNPDSPESALASPEPTEAELRRVDMGLFVSYIHACCRIRVSGKTKKEFLMRVIKLISMRMDKSVSRWVSIVWRPLLKVLDVPAKDLGLSPDEQLQLIIHAIRQMEESQGAPLSVFVHACRIIRKIAYREVRRLVENLEAETTESKTATGIQSPQHSLATLSLKDLYFERDQDPSPKQTTVASTMRHQTSHGMDLRRTRALFLDGASLLKDVFLQLVQQEKSVRQMMGSHEIPVLERMSVRKDPVRADHAHDYLLMLGFVGEFEEMLTVTRWLIMEWGQDEVCKALLQIEDVPGYARLLQPLCVYRLLAEPRLAPTETINLRQELKARGLEWMWPSDEAVEAYGQGTKGQSASRLAQALNVVDRDPRGWAQEKASREQQRMTTEARNIQSPKEGLQGVQVRTPSVDYEHAASNDCTKANRFITGAI